MCMVRRMLAVFLSVVLLIGVSGYCYAGADGALKIGDGDGFLLKGLEIVDVYNDLMSGRDPNYPEADELLKIRVDRYGKSYFSSFISVKKSTNQFAVFFNLGDDLIQNENEDTVPDLILIFTKGRKEWVEKDDSVQMLPDLLAAFAYLCDPGIKDAAAARDRAAEIMELSSETHDWVTYGGMDYYCIVSPMKEADGHLSLNLTIAIKLHSAETLYTPW